MFDSDLVKKIDWITILLVLAFPVRLVCVLFVGGIALLIPIALVCLAGGILRACT